MLFVHLLYFRFAEFIEGGSHLSDEEMMSYQTEFSFDRNPSFDDEDLIFTSDEDET